MSGMAWTRPLTLPRWCRLPDWPLVVWMVGLSLLLGLFGGSSPEALIGEFNRGFGRALGEFALILLPSFTLAAALSKRRVVSDAAGRTAALSSPVAGAGMICPDTAYAALSPAAGRYKLDTAFGAYAGFKLLYPAGPLIVATGLGATGADTGTTPGALLLCGALLTVPVWAAVAAVARLGGAIVPAHAPQDSIDAHGGRLWISFAPFLLMAALLLLGGLLGPTGVEAIDFLLMPKGALLAAAALALSQTPATERRDCLDSAVHRSAGLLLIIGAASAFGTVLTGLWSFHTLVPPESDTLTLVVLFALTVAFKLAQGSSMATFAAIGPIAAPLVAASGVDMVAAVFAVCLGSFIAILPNDSYYWIVRRDALAEAPSEARCLGLLAGGATAQGLLGLAILLIGVNLWR